MAALAISQRRVWLASTGWTLRGLGAELWHMVGAFQPSLTAPCKSSSRRGSARAQFAATACTIVSGAIAERAKFEAYICYSFFMASWVYPVRRRPRALACRGGDGRAAAGAQKRPVPYAASSGTAVSAAALGGDAPSMRAHASGWEDELLSEWAAGERRSSCTARGRTRASSP